MDLRRWGSEYEKKFMELTNNDIQKVASVFHNWQRNTDDAVYENIPEFCYSANIDELKENNYSLVPSKYIEFADKDSGIDFDTEMKRIQTKFKTLLNEEKESQNQLIEAFKILGYEL